MAAQQGSSRPRCFNCNNFGHLSRDCKYRRRNKEHVNTTQTGEENREDTEECEDEITCAAYLSLATVNNNKVQIACNEWVLDSGPLKHMCNNKKLIDNLCDSNTSTVTSANHSRAEVQGEGEITLLSIGSPKPIELKLQYVLYVPNLSVNLISVSAITKTGHRVVFQ